MVRWSVSFLGLALAASLLGFGGFGGPVGEAAWAGQLLLGLFFALALMAFVLERRVAPD